MTLQDIFDDLAFGELSQLAIGGLEGSDPMEPQIAEKDRPSLIRHINKGLNAIYKRFRLREKTVIIQLQDDKSSYVLDRRFAITNTQSNEPNKYLLDTDDKFDNTLLKVEQVWGWVGDCWVPVALNQTGNVHSLRTPSMKTLVVPDDFKLQAKPTKLKVLYRAEHPYLDPNIATYTAMGTVLDLPSTHLPALLYYVTSRIMNPVGMMEEFHSGNTYYGKYEAECARLEGENYQIDDMENNSNFARQGFI